jgi:hypothetical protein
MEKPVRSRRSKKTEPSALQTTLQALTTASASASALVKGSKKKQFSVVAVVTPNGIEGSLQPEARKPLIAHLPIQSKDIQFHDAPIQYNPVPPTNVEPYDATIDNPFSESVEILAVAEPGPLSGPLPGPPLVAPTNTTSAAAVTPDVPDYYKKSTLLVQYQTAGEVRALPSKVDAACFWCCHTFDWCPVILPVRDQGEYIQVQGNFCCPECAMSYLFDMRQDSHTRWEQLSILNRLYEDAVGGPIRPAPPRQALKLFGGPMSIDEYRALMRKRKLRVDIHMPPMVSLLATMDTKPIDFYDVSLTRNVMDTVGERLAKAEEVLKLRRTKPLKAWESTLDACINLKVRSPA